MEKEKYVITIGRQFGSGGRELGRRLAERLGIKYYDKELLLEAARKAGVNPEFFERSDERFPSFLSGLFSFALGYSSFNLYAGSSSISDEQIYKAQSDFIRSLGIETSCVIVGRTADYVLRDHPHLISIFVHAPVEECVRRIMRRGDFDSPDKARSHAAKVNRLRADYYNFYTDRTWGAAASYNLTVDTSLMTMDELVDFLADYVGRRLKR